MSVCICPSAGCPMEEQVTNENCKNCGEKIETMTFRGTDFCSVKCRKAAGDDVPSVGTHMFVTKEEERRIRQVRANGIRR